MNSIFLLLFGIVLVGIVVFFINYKNSSEGFQVNPNTTVIESDRFYNNTLNPVTPTFTSFSTLNGIKENFKVYVTDWHNFSGNRDRTFKTYHNAVDITYSDYYGNLKQERLNGFDIPVNKDVDNGAPIAPLRYGYTFLHYFNGQTWVNKDFILAQNSKNMPTNRFLTRSQFTGNLVRTNECSEIGDCVPLKINDYKNNFNKFIRSIQVNKSELLRKFQQGLEIWNLANFQKKIDPSIYIPISYYKATKNSQAANWWAGGITVYGVENRSVYVDYNLGIFKGNDYLPPKSLQNAQNEILKLNVYGTFCNYHSNDFRECLHWGCAFDFDDASLLDMFLNVPYYDTLMNGSNIFYSYGHFFPEVKPKSTTEPFVFVPNNVCISNNATLVSRIRVSENTLLGIPSNEQIPIVTFDNDANITSIKYGDNLDLSQLGSIPVSLTNASLQQQFIGKISPIALAKMPIMMRRFIISWVYNRTMRTLDSRLDNEKWNNDGTSYNINKAALLISLAYNNRAYYNSISDTRNAAIWSAYLTKYFYSGFNILSRDDNTNKAGDDVGELSERRTNNSPNPEINALATAVLFGNHENNFTNKVKGLTFRKSDSAYWGQKWTTSVPQNITTNTNFIFYTLDIRRNDNLSYKTTGNIWDLTGETIQNMTADYKALVYKIQPDYGIASNINVLDQKMLDSIAQNFYELSDGLFEIKTIYDVYPVGSNMLDIRFDKKQLLGQVSYLTLRNRFQPKIIEYNTLISLYEQNTWQKSYSNVNDLLSNISTIKKRDLEEVFNPVYTIGNRNPNDIRSEIGRLEASNTVLNAELTGINTVVTTNTNLNNTTSSNYISNLLNSSTSPLIDLNLVQQKIDSNDNLLINLSNQLDGIETNVARIFFTMTNSSNITINGVAVGPNAALTYNTVYNAGMQADMGSSQGNVNYTPTIIYTKNVPPVIDPTNIEFMKKTSQLYMDAIFNSLSSFTSNIYKEDEGFVRIDKIFGSAKLDDKTVGFTWQESQYDFLTNEPNVQRIVDIVLKFDFDNIYYQEPQLLIDNRVSNIYINSNIFDSTQSNFLLENRTKIASYESNINVIRNDIRILTSNNTTITSNISIRRNDISYFQNELINNTNMALQLASNYLDATNNTIYGTNENFVYFVRTGETPYFNYTSETRIKVSARRLRNVFSNSYSELTVQNFFDFYNTLQDLDNGITQSENTATTRFKLSGGNYVLTSLENTVQTLPTFRFISKVIGSELNTDFPYYKTEIDSLRNNINNNRLSIDGLNATFSNNLSIIVTKTQQINELNGLIDDIQLTNSNLTLVNRRFKFTKFTNEQGNIFNSNDFMRYKNTIENLPSNLTNVTYSNLAIKLFYSLDESMLDDSDGVCPANIICGNTAVMRQLVEEYNFDSNNSDKILRIFKSFTPNPFRCDYSVEMINSNRQTKKGTIAFDVGQNIEDCSYFISSNHGFNKGYYIIDTVDPTKDTVGSDISGFNFVGNALFSYSNAVVNTFNPLINSASNAISNIIQAVGASRLNTFEALGKFNSLTVKNCPVVPFDNLLILLNKAEFIDNIFKSHPFFENRIARILNVGISDSNKIDVSFEVEYLNYSTRRGVGTAFRKSEGARFMITTSESLCDYHPIFMCNISPLPSRETLNTSNTTATYAFPNNKTPNIIKNNPFNYAYTVLDAQSIELNSLIRNDIFTINSLNYNIRNIVSYLRVDVNKFMFSLESFGGMGNRTALYEIGRDPFSQFNKQVFRSKTILTTAQRNSYISQFGPMLPYNNSVISSNCKIGEPESPIYTSNGNFFFTGNALNELKNVIGIRDIYDYRLKTSSSLPISNSFEGELIVYNNVVELPVNRTNLYVAGYYNNCKLFITNCLPVTPPSVQTLFRYTPSLHSDMAAINVCRNYFNKTYSNINNYSELSKVYNAKINSDGTVTYGTSVYYKTSSNTYNFNILPNDIRYNSLKYFKVQFGKRLNAVFIVSLEEVNKQNDLLDVNDTSQIVQSNFNYFMSNLRFNAFKFEPTTVGDSNYQLIQIELYYNSIFKHTNLYNYIQNRRVPTSEEAIEIGLIFDENNTYLNPGDGSLAYIDEIITPVYGFLTSHENVNRNEETGIQIYEFDRTNSLININLENSIPITGYTIATGDDENKCLNSWKLYGAIDSSNFFLLNSTNNYTDSSNYPSAFYRTPILSVFDNTSNIPLSQYPFYQKSLAQCGINPINSNTITYLVNLFPSIFPSQNVEYSSDFLDSGISRESVGFNENSYNIKDIISYKINTRTVDFLVNIFKDTDPPTVNPTYYTIVMRLKFNIRVDCSYTFNYTGNSNNFRTFVDVIENQEVTTTFSYNNMLVTGFTPIPNETFISNIFYNHSVRGTYLGCDSNFSSDKYQPLASLFEYIYFYGDENIEGPVLLRDFGTSNSNIPALIPNISNVNLESLNILYSKIDTLRNNISYVLDVNTSRSNSTPVSTKFVYTIRSPLIRDCEFIEYNLSYDAAATFFVNNNSLTGFVALSNYTLYTSSNTFQNVKSQYLRLEGQRLSNCFPTVFNTFNMFLSNFPTVLFGNYNDLTHIDLRFKIPYYKIDISNSTYKIILKDVTYKTLYTYENSSYEGTFLYNDEITNVSILNTYLQSNIPTLINFSNTSSRALSSNFEIVIEFDSNAQNSFIRCSRGRDYDINDILGEDSDITLNNLGVQNISNYVRNNNYTENANSNFYETVLNNTNQEHIFNSNYYNTNVVKSNCEIQFTDEINIINKLQNYAELDSIYNTLFTSYGLTRSFDFIPEIVYGKISTSDSLRYNYIVKMFDVNGSPYYVELSFKFYYGTLSNTVYKDRLYFLNSNLFCSYNYFISLSNVFGEEVPVLYASQNGYTSSVASTTASIIVRERILSNMANCSTRLQPLSATFLNTITQEMSFTYPNSPPTDTIIYKKILYYKNSLAQLSNNYVFSIHTSNNLPNPDYVEYSLNIQDLQNNCAISLRDTFIRKLSYNDVLRLPNSNYVPFFDNINIETNLSNHGINNNFLLSNTRFDGPLSTNLNDYLFVAGVNPDNFGSPIILFNRYQNRLGTVNYSYIISLNNVLVEYGIYFFYAPLVNSNFSNVESAIYLNTSITNIFDYANQNGYVSAVSGFTESQKMSIFNLNATNSTFINLINNNLSNLKNNPVFSSNIVSIRYVKTDFTNLKNSYAVAYWPLTTNLTFNSLLNTPPDYLQYTIQLNSIQSPTSYSYLANSVVTNFTEDLDDYTVYQNSIFYQNGERTVTSFTEILYTPSNCYSSFNASNLIPYVTGLQLNTFITNPNVDLTQQTIRGVVAFKNSSTNLSYDYICEIRTENGVYYYPEFRIRLSGPTPFESCDAYLEENQLEPSFVSLVQFFNLPAYILTNGYTRNTAFIVQAPTVEDSSQTSTETVAAATETPSENLLDETFKNYQLIEKNKHIYTLLMFESDKSFKLQNFKLYTFNDIEIRCELSFQNKILYVKNSRNYIIKGYSFITNSVSSDYDPKSWVLKGTTDGRSWTVLDSQSIGRILPRNYQLPLMYFDGRTKSLPQPVSKMSDKPQINKIDKESLIKYYKQKINPSIKPEFKKYMRDNDTYYCLFDAYDLNRNKIATDLIVGFVLVNEKVKKAILYEDDDGNFVPFNLRDQKIKNYWERNVMLPLLFQDF